MLENQGKLGMEVLKGLENTELEEDENIKHSEILDVEDENKHLDKYEF